MTVNLLYLVTRYTKNGCFFSLQSSYSPRIQSLRPHYHTKPCAIYLFDKEFGTKMDERGSRKMKYSAETESHHIELSRTVNESSSVSRCKRLLYLHFFITSLYATRHKSVNYYYQLLIALDTYSSLRKK